MRAASDEAARIRFPPCFRTLAVVGSWQGSLGGWPALPCRPISPPKSLKIGASLSPRKAPALVAGIRDPGISGFRLCGFGSLCRRSCTSAGVCPLGLGFHQPSCWAMPTASPHIRFKPASPCVRHSRNQTFINHAGRLRRGGPFSFSPLLSYTCCRGELAAGPLGG